jgi:microcystin-dependent protein
MGQPYVGEIRMFAGSFAPAGWMTCDGQVLPISEYDTLFNLIGTTFGGDGVSTFLLPNLASRVPVHMGQGSGLSNYVLGQTGGVTSVTLTANQMPIHAHAVAADSAAGTTGDPHNNYYASAAPQAPYTVPNDSNNPAGPTYVNMNAAMLPSQGGSQAHDNMQPYQAITFIISLFGIYPSQT